MWYTFSDLVYTILFVIISTARRPAPDPCLLTVMDQTLVQLCQKRRWQKVMVAETVLILRVRERCDDDDDAVVTMLLASSDARRRSILHAGRLDRCRDQRGDFTSPSRPGPARSGPAWSGPVRPGPARSGPVRSGPVRPLALTCGASY